jgi:predicted lipid-binding transport protein (Tim44 family)
MTDVATKTVDQQLVKKTHPIRGILWGLMMGLGLSIVLVLTKVIPLALVPMLIVLVLGTIVGTVWSIFGPAKHAKDVPSTTPQSADAEAETEAEAAAPLVDETQPAGTAAAGAPDQPG